MSDERDKEGHAPGFTVSDRRKRYDGSGESAPSPEPPPAPAATPEPAAAAAPPAEAPPEPEPAHLPGDATLGAGLPGPAEFVQLVAKLYQDGLAFMGLFDDPAAGQSLANFTVASWHIDILEVLQEKTKGNLGAEEQKLLADAIANMKLMFVRASGTIKK